MIRIGAVPVGPESEISTGEVFRRLLSLPELELLAAFAASFMAPIAVSIVIRMALRFHHPYPID